MWIKYIHAYLTRGSLWTASKEPLVTSPKLNVSKYDNIPIWPQTGGESTLIGFYL